MTDFKNILTSRAHHGNVVSVGFSPDGRHIVSSSYNNVVKVWDAKTLEEVRTFHGQSVSSARPCFGPAGNLFATADFSGSLTLRDLQTGEVVRKLKGHSDKPLQSICFSPDGSQIAAGSVEGVVESWSTQTGESLWKTNRHSYPIRSICFNEQGTLFASAEFNSSGTIKLWDAHSGDELRTIQGASFIQCLRFSPDGKTLASAGRLTTIWSVSSGQMVCGLRGASGDAESLSFNTDGTRIVTGGQDGTLRLWNTGTGEELKTLTDDATAYHAVQFSPDGMRIVSGSSDGAIRLWNARPTNEIKRLEGHLNGVRCVGFGPNRSLLASGGTDATIKLWDTENGSIIRTLQGHSEPVDHVRFSTDGKRLYSRSTNERFVWQVASGKIIPDAEWTQMAAATRRGNLRARVSGNQILLLDLDWKHTEDEKAYRSSKAGPKPWWHREQWQLCIHSQDWYAATFHAAWLLTLDPDSLSAYFDFHHALRQLKAAGTGDLPLVVQAASRCPRPNSNERRARSEAIAKVLAGPPLPAVETELANLHELLSIPVFLDIRGLESIGVDATAPVKLSAGHKSFQDQLDDALNKLDLSWCTTQTVLVLTSQTALKKRFADVRLYRLATPRGDFKSVLRRVQQVAPESWEAMGGSGYIAPIGTPPVVLESPASFFGIVQSPAIHRELVKTLEIEPVPHQYAHPLDLQSVSLSIKAARITEILASISEQINVPIEVSPDADFLSWQRHAIDIDLENVSAKDALDLLLHPMDCTWIERGKIVIHDQQHALAQHTTQRFAIPPKREMDSKRVISTIVNFVRPGSWLGFGGDGEVTESETRPGHFSVKQGQPVMREVEQFIRDLEAVR